MTQDSYARHSGCWHVPGGCGMPMASISCRPTRGSRHDTAARPTPLAGVDRLDRSAAAPSADNRDPAAGGHTDLAATPRGPRLAAADKAAVAVAGPGQLRPGAVPVPCLLGTGRRRDTAGDGGRPETAGDAPASRPLHALPADFLSAGHRAAVRPGPADLRPGG